MRVNVAQRSPEWFEARRGKITASVAAACLGLDPHMGQLAAYRKIMGITGQSSNKHTAWGEQFEPVARSAYECETGNLVAEGGFWVHDDLPWLAASPDGLVGEDGLLEIKCPGKLPPYIPLPHSIQMAVQMAVTDRSWCDYFVWCGNQFFLDNQLRKAAPERLLLAGLTKFYERYIATQTEPPRRRVALLLKEGAA